MDNSTNKGTAYIQRQTAYNLLDSVIRQLEGGPMSDEQRQLMAEALRDAKRLIMISTPY